MYAVAPIPYEDGERPWAPMGQSIGPLPTKKRGEGNLQKGVERALEQQSVEQLELSIPPPGEGVRVNGLTMSLET